MFDKLVETGAVFDWITPLFTFVQDFRNRPSVGYNVPVDSGWSAYAISDLLRAHGIKVWGLTIFQGTIMFRLRSAQAEYAQYLLAQNGVLYSGGLDAAKRTHKRGRTGRTPIPLPPAGTQPTSSAEAPAEPSRRQSLDGLLDGSIRSINRFVNKLPGA
jgi:hypothetical protein